MQCYTILYSDEGSFLTFTKRFTAFFFHSATGGQLYPDGVPITNGPGLFAFPGGRQDPGEQSYQASLREFTEECGVQINFSYNPVTSNALANLALININGSPYHILSTDSLQTKNYYALYLEVDPDDLAQIEMLISDTNLEENANAAAEVNDGNFGTYQAIYNYYPYCPADNELSEASMWDIQANINEIRALNNNGATDWYYQMIVYLANHILNAGIPY